MKGIEQLAALVWGGVQQVPVAVDSGRHRAMSDVDGYALHVQPGAIQCEAAQWRASWNVNRFRPDTFQALSILSVNAFTDIGTLLSVRPGKSRPEWWVGQDSVVGEGLSRTPG
jgi:hypothetical protein